MANDRTQASGRQAGASQGVLLLAASALPAMGVVLLSPIAVQLPNEIGPGPGGMDLTPIILTAPALAIAIFSSLAGYLLDKVGRRICFLIAMFVYAVLGTAPLWLENVYLIVMTRFGLGMTEAVIMTAAIALVGDYFSGSTRDRWVASMMAVTALAATLFYILGGVLGAVSWKAPFAAYGASFVLFLAALWLIFEPDTSYRAGADRNETVVDKHPRHFSFAMAPVHYQDTDSR